MKVTYYGEDNYNVVFDGTEFDELSELFERGMLWSLQNDEPNTYQHLKEFTDKYKSLFKED